eukprot:4390538-Amphidinium_carterae.1
MLSEFLDNCGKVKTQYLGPDNGLEHDCNEARALHKWTVVDNDNLIINKKVKISDNVWQCQWSSPIPIESCTPQSRSPSRMTMTPSSSTTMATLTSSTLTMS